MEPLTKEEKELWLEKNNKLLHYWANKFKSYLNVDYQDLYQTAYVGALTGLNKFNKKKKRSNGLPVDVTPYVSGYIRSALQVYVGKNYGAASTTFMNLIKNTDKFINSTKEVDTIDEESLTSDLTIELEQKEISKSYLNLLTGIIKEATEFKYGISNVINPEIIPMVDELAFFGILQIKQHISRENLY